MKKLKEIIKGINFIQNWGNKNISINGIKFNSKDVKGGDCFVAIKGFKYDGNHYIRDAIKNGAAVIFSLYPPKDEFKNITWFQVNDDRLALSRLSINFYEISKIDMNIIGVTGTNGKTTVALLIKDIIGRKDECGFIGTLGTQIAGLKKTTNLTTPESVDLASFINQLQRRECKNLVMEVSSVAIELDRIAGIPFKVGVFTNFSGDHLDFHQNLDNYFSAKLKFFQTLGSKDTAIINLDDLKAKEIVHNLNSKILTYGYNSSADIFPLENKFSMDGIQAMISTPLGVLTIKSKLLGKINLSNILCAIASAIALNCPLNQITDGIYGFSPPKGRLDLIYDKEFKIIIDYAHTDKALEEILDSVRDIKGSGKMIVIFGAGGDRDKTKRPRMGRIASQFADYIILTNDNPRSEEPRDIVKDIISGFISSFSDYQVELDRREAIKKAINMARANDILLIAGKGHEDYQIFKDRTVHFDDFEVVEESLNS